MLCFERTKKKEEGGAMRKKGFTLLEVLIVVIIIGILASIAMPQYMSTLQKAKSSEALTNLGSIRSAMGRYYYEQIALTSAYAQINGTDLSKLDVAVTGADWTYTMVDTTSTLGTGPSLFVIKAAKATDPTIYWIDIDQTGKIARSTALGGDDVHL